MKKKDFYYRQKGSIAIYAVATILCFIILLGGTFLASSAVRKNQLRTLSTIKEAYNQQIGQVDKILETRKLNDVSGYKQNGLVLFLDGFNNNKGNHSNNTNNWKDLSNENNNGMLINMQASWRENSLHFDGQNDLVSVPYKNSLAPNAFTIELVLNIEDIVNDKSIIFVKWEGYTIELNRNKTVSFGVKNNSSYLNSTYLLDLGKKCCITVSYKDKVQKIYINGVKVKERTIDTNLEHTQTDLTIGAKNGNYPFKGNIYSVRMYNRELTEKEISDNYNLDDERYNITTLEDFNELKGVNTPKLGKDMTPVKWNGTELENTVLSDPDWYDYSQKKWANAKTEDGSMWVWIPRYAYKINEGNYHTSEAGEIEIKFLKGTTNEAADGVTPTWANASGAENWNIHPVFTTNVNKGGWGSEILGIWVAKFEASNNGGNIKVVPNVASWRSINVNDIFTKCKNAKYGGTADLGSHMMKNSEWGAVAYLSQSEFGKNAEVWINPNSSYITGQAGTGASAGSTATTDAYNEGNGPKASTTGNVYGIYDMSGGSWEYVAAYIDNSHGNLQTNGESLVKDDVEGKYRNVYTVSTTSDTNTNNYAENIAVYGDAVYETSNNGTGNTSWYSNSSNFPYMDVPFFLRGGYFSDGSNAGVFHSSCEGGNMSINFSFRPVLVID